ncbi:tetratricopeptide repeat protein [Ulvibacter antarcticus]|uniref:Tetratricopeptide repeat protein n=1 Tax=Ulvibacter antarcticus TaxID=442714 RepID=A0A3L9Z2B0_9FLAO|nr:SH3 domain-containing protein [Ulvibacter antarcticus]RMA66137.1 tetratricopeptide repeat protein [Ulvibacter antarcticus]
MKKILYISILLFSVFCFGQNNPLFEQGKERYKEGKFQDAIENWMKILKDGEHSSNLYFNLGNAHYKLNQIGPSIYYYEKALQLDPLDSDIKTNLAFAENTRIDAIEPLPKTIFAKWHKTLAGILDFDGWAIVSVVCSMLFVLLFLLYYFSASEKRKRLLFAGSLLSVLLLCLSLAMAFQVQSEVKNDKPAIIFAESVEVKSEPNLGSAVAFRLHEGTKVQVLAEDNDWVRIQLVNGKDGWMPVNDLKKL